nr:unnamed protein product [Spirometra erinaceieuropaei]
MDVLERTEILSIYATLRQLQLWWGGHLARMEYERLPKLHTMKMSHRVPADKEAKSVPARTLTARTHRMGLFGHMRIHENGIDRNLDTPSTSCTSTMPSSTHTPPPSAHTIRSYITTVAAITETDTGTADFSCPHCPHTFTLHNGLVGHL